MGAAGAAVLVVRSRASGDSSAGEHAGWDACRWRCDQPESAGAVVSVDGQQKMTIQTPGDAEPIEVKADEAAAHAASGLKAASRRLPRRSPSNPAKARPSACGLSR